MHDSHIFIGLTFSKVGISNLISQFVRQWPEKKFNTDGYELELKNFEKDIPKITACDKTVYSEVPVTFSFIKRAGLFSIEGEGKISIKVKFDFDVLHDFSLQVVSHLVGYEWLEEPVLKVGKLDIPIENLSNCIINYFKEGMLQKLDKFILEKIDIPAILQKQIKAFGQNYPISRQPDLYFNFSIASVLAGKLAEDEKDIKIDLWLDMSSNISDEMVRFEVETKPVFYWAVEKPDIHFQRTDIQFSYYGLARIIMNALNGNDIGGKTFDIESIHIRKTSFLEIKADIKEPVQGIVTITAQPYLNRQDQKIYAGTIKVDIDAKNFIYKLSSPIIEKIILKKLESFFPLDAAPFFAGYIKKIPSFNFLNNQISLTPNVDKVRIDHLIFGEQQLNSSLIIEKAELGIVLERN